MKTVLLLTIGATVPLLAQQLSIHHSDRGIELTWPRNFPPSSGVSSILESRILSSPDLYKWVEETAASYAVKTLVLETRIELIENHITFEKLGFVKTAETTHDGFEQPTGVWMEKTL